MKYNNKYLIAVLKAGSEAELRSVIKVKVLFVRFTKNLLIK